MFTASRGKVTDISEPRGWQNSLLKSRVVKRIPLLHRPSRCLRTNRAHRYVTSVFVMNATHHKICISSSWKKSRSRQLLQERYYCDLFNWLEQSLWAGLERWDFFQSRRVHGNARNIVYGKYQYDTLSRLCHTFDGHPQKHNDCGVYIDRFRVLAVASQPV